MLGFIPSLDSLRRFEFCGIRYLIVPAQSCGCGADAAPISRSENFRYVGNSRESSFYSADNIMMSDLIAANDLYELLAYINWYTYQIQPFSSFYLFLNDDWIGESDGGEYDYRREGYPDKMHMRLIRREGITEQIVDEVFNSREMLPDTEKTRDDPAVFYFTPLFFGDRAFGYTVIGFEESRSITVDYRGWVRGVCDSLECMRRHIHIRNMYDRLEKAALSDSLTGIYNRNAFNIHMESLTSGTDTAVPAMFMMADLNFLKTINDTYGHLAGDKAIQTVAKAINSVCGENERCYRFGGDEFMIVGTGEYTESQIGNITYSIHKYLSDFNASSGHPFMVMASLGPVCGTITNAADVDALIRSADKTMYQNKQRSKMENPSPFRC